jgi:hypothetical protein
MIAVMLRLGTVALLVSAGTAHAESLALSFSSVMAIQEEAEPPSPATGGEFFISGYPGQLVDRRQRSDGGGHEIQQRQLGYLDHQLIVGLGLRF